MGEERKSPRPDPHYEAKGIRFEGVAASPGIAVGRAFVIDRRRIRTPKYHIPPEEVDAELLRLETGIKLSEHQLQEIRTRMEAEGEGQEHLLILQAHQLMVRDDMLVKEAERLVREERINAEWAIRRTIRRIKRVFDEIDHEYFRERRGDVDFVGDRIIRNLMGQVVDVDEAPPEDAVVVAHDLSPADTVVLARHRILGIVTDVGAKTSHSAIVARALEIPAVLGCGRISELIGRGDTVVVDGTHGVVILSPTAREADQYRGARRRYLAAEKQLLADRDLPAETTDGRRIQLLGNIEFAREVDSVVEHGGEGVGLYRTEFLYLGRRDLPSEAEHYQVYKEILERLAPRPVTIRTFDLGGDKVPLSGRAREPNPAMGLRALRLCLKEPQIILPQLRALLRAGTAGNLRIMFPMISGLGELRDARALLDEARASLAQDGIEHAAEVPVGIMVELPSAAVIADVLAAECDFMSIGTNDLIQYALGIDRQNREVSYLYKPLHPAVLRLIRMVADAGRARGIPAMMCGEMAGEPLYAPILTAMGLTSLSMNPGAIPLVKRIVRACSAEEAGQLLEEVLSLSTVGEIERLVQARVRGRFAALLDEAS